MTWSMVRRSLDTEPIERRDQGRHSGRPGRIASAGAPQLSLHRPGCGRNAEVDGQRPRRVGRLSRCTGSLFYEALKNYKLRRSSRPETVTSDSWCPRTRWYRSAACTTSARAVALVTGSGSGNGRATVLRLAEAGARVCGFDIDQAAENRAIGHPDRAMAAGGDSGGGGAIVNVASKSSVAPGHHGGGAGQIGRAPRGAAAGRRRRPRGSSQPSRCSASSSRSWRNRASTRRHGRAREPL
jgi:hypothetical protein